MKQREQTFSPKYRAEPRRLPGAITFHQPAISSSHHFIIAQSTLHAHQVHNKQAAIIHAERAEEVVHR